MRRHIAIVAAVIERLAEARTAATGGRHREKDARFWLHTRSVDTRQGVKAPIEILADSDLAIVFLRELLR